MDISYIETKNKEKAKLTVKDPHEEHKLTMASQFRLISTGVESNNTILARNPVQIQHVESKMFLCKKPEETQEKKKLNKVNSGEKIKAFSAAGDD